MKLSESQRIHYQTYGYVVLRQWLPSPAMQALMAEAHGALARSYGQVPADHRKEQASLAMGPDTPMLAAALEQPLLFDAAKALFGDDVLGIASYVTSHTGDTGWHADSPDRFPRGVKFSLYLQSMTVETGALRVLPGSHRDAYHDQIRAWLRDPAREGGDLGVPGVVCSTEPGDVIAFDLRLFHAALGGDGDRRVINLFYYQNPPTTLDEQRTREQIVEDFEWLANKNRGDARVFDSHWLQNSGGNSVRARWIERFREMGFFEGEGGELGTFAATPLSTELQSAVSGLLPVDWRLIRTSQKTELLRVVMEVDGREVTLMVRPEADPHPRFKAISELAFGYSMLDCGELLDQRAEEFEALIDGLAAEHQQGLLQAMRRPRATVSV